MTMQETFEQAVKQFMRDIAKEYSDRLTDVDARVTAIEEKIKQASKRPS